MIQLTHCDICKQQLKPHPLHPSNVAMSCHQHGDYFVYQERGKEPTVVFRPFESVPRKRRAAKSPQPAKPKTVSKNRVGRVGYTIRCEETGAIFASLIEAAWSLSVAQSDLTKHLQGKRLTVGGFTFNRLIEDGLGGHLVVQRPNRIKGDSTVPIRLQCVETGQVFRSIRQAARELNLGRGNLYNHLRGAANRKRVGGYTFIMTSQKLQGL